MKQLIEDNYKSIVKRGLITPSTTPEQFIMKLEEEIQEFIDAWIHGDKNHLSEELAEELADIILTAMNYAYHFNIDIEQELKSKVKKNYKRA